METGGDAGVLPCPHFEGVEKRVEIDFHDGNNASGTLPGRYSKRVASRSRRDRRCKNSEAVSTATWKKP